MIGVDILPDILIEVIHLVDIQMKKTIITLADVIHLTLGIRIRQMKYIQVLDILIKILVDRVGIHLIVG